MKPYGEDRYSKMAISNLLSARKVDAEIAPMLRKVGQNFVMPIFSGEVDAEIIQKENPATGPSPLTIADVGVQILVTREIERIYGDPREAFSGRNTFRTLHNDNKTLSIRLIWKHDLRPHAKMRATYRIA